MRAQAMSTTNVGPDQTGWVITQDVRSREGRRLFRKGAVIDEGVLEGWDEVADGELHLLKLDADDVHEDVAGGRIATAVAGDGIRITGPIQSRYNLVADCKGLLKIDPERIRAINRVAGVTVFTHLDRQAVLPGKIVAGVKITPIAVPESSVREVEQISSATGQPVIDVLQFKKKRIAILATEGLNEKMRARFQERVERKMRWYGSEVTEVRFVEANPLAVAQTFKEFRASGIDIMMAAGGNTIDPLDPIFLALDEIGAEMIHFGAPAHPGSMFWLASVDGTPIFNLASCSMYSQATVADLILPLVMTGQQVTSDDIVDLGYGGLLEREMAFRFPDYEAEQSDEEDG